MVQVGTDTSHIQRAKCVSDGAPREPKIEDHEVAQIRCTIADAVGRAIGFAAQHRCIISHISSDIRCCVSEERDGLSPRITIAMILNCE